MFERWDEVELDLRVEATLALDGGGAPRPLLAAFDEHGPMAVVGLRPFDGDGVLAALVEVLALLLPLGARRLALGLPGRACEPGPAGGRAPDRPAESPVAGGPDGRGPDPGADGTALLVVATAEALGGDEPRLTGRVLPLAHDGDCWQWREDAAVDLDADAWDVTRAMGVLLRAPALGTDRPGGDDDLRAQLGRCLLRGHTVALTPATADLLEPASPHGRGPHPPPLDA